QTARGLAQYGALWLALARLARDSRNFPNRSQGVALGYGLLHPFRATERHVCGRPEARGDLFARLLTYPCPSPEGKGCLVARFARLLYGCQGTTGRQTMACYIIADI